MKKRKITSVQTANDAVYFFDFFFAFFGIPF